MKKTMILRRPASTTSVLVLLLWLILLRCKSTSSYFPQLSRSLSSASSSSRCSSRLTVWCPQPVWMICVAALCPGWTSTALCPRSDPVSDQHLSRTFPQTSESFTAFLNKRPCILISPCLLKFVFGVDIHILQRSVSPWFYHVSGVFSSMIETESW